MIDRSYLPYQSAREYTDRGMAKWMGFFISEHSTALSKEGDTVDFSKTKGGLPNCRLPNFSYSQILRLTPAEVTEDE